MDMPITAVIISRERQCEHLRENFNPRRDDARKQYEYAACVPLLYQNPETVATTMAVDTFGGFLNAALALHAVLKALK